MPTDTPAFHDFKQKRPKSLKTLDLQARTSPCRVYLNSLNYLSFSTRISGSLLRLLLNPQLDQVDQLTDRLESH